MSPEQLAWFRERLMKLWLISPERLWLLSIALRKRGHWVLAFWLKQLNTLIYHNSLATGSSVGSDIRLGHYSLGVVVAENVVIGQKVKIWHNVTLTAGMRARGRSSPPSKIIIEDGVTIGTNAVIIAPRGETLRVGRGARIGAGVVVTHDVPFRATVVGPPPRVLLRDRQGNASISEGPSAQESSEAPSEG
jgi:serine O-acetyltransferase